MRSTTRRAARLGAVAPAASALVLALALTACGSDADSGDSSEVGGSSESEGSGDSGDRIDVDDEGDDGGTNSSGGDAVDSDGSDDEPGTVSLAVGETSEPVLWTNGSTEAMLAVTATEVFIGENEDLDPETFSTPDATEGMRPVHIHFDFAHADGDHIDMIMPSERTTLKLKLADDEGWGENVQAYQPLGMPDGCDDAAPTNSYELPVGESFYDCRTFLIPEDAEAAEVHWLAAEETLVWRI
ncbi:hypothetical protein [Streptomyces lonarensis]|uniref:Lipoprotein n=1 Tax=Streptomyces lonarensis TaxID=700599 RepID=A0A7X6D5L0_9ACTN|nr:hypothetical protein [Streptomyces lonarensis]NJQ08597.1 hypothetical protein [Streptomyces lonarensis]